MAIEFTPSTFGDLNAEEYDALHDPGTTDDSVALISELAGSGRILELAIGTGRMALPLAHKGHDVSGIEGSPDMLDIMREKPGGADITAIVGDYADVGLDGPFDFVFLVFNTLFNLTSQADQVRCFQNVGAKLAPGGAFLVETFVPDFSDYQNHPRMRAKEVGFDSVKYEAVLHDPLTQKLDMQRIRIKGSDVSLKPLPMRYAWPAEIDLMAKLGGMDLETRWGGWRRESFTKDSKMHVSVYRKPA